MKIHFIIHEDFEGAGYFQQWLTQHAYQSSYSRVYLDESLPSDCTDFDFLIILGGPQNPATTVAECAHFDSAAEQALISNAYLEHKIVLGICLGAQLIGETLGAQHEKSPEKEIGYYPIKLTQQGINDPLLSGFNLSEIVGHWHADMPGLTDSAKVLASSQGCPRQIVRYAPLVYGFQCHLEFLSSDFPGLIAHNLDDFSTAAEHRFVQSEESILSINTEHMNHLLADFLDNLVAAYLQQKNGNE